MKICLLIFFFLISQYLTQAIIIFIHETLSIKKFFLNSINILDQQQRALCENNKSMMIVNNFNHKKAKKKKED